MIQLTRLNNHPLVVNSDLIKFVEQAPDTVITLVNGDKIVVRESAEDVLGRVVQFRRSVLQGITPWSETGFALPPIDSSDHKNAKGQSKDNDQPAAEE
jgi:flagellar protein FlbD